MALPAPLLGSFSSIRNTLFMNLSCSPVLVAIRAWAQLLLHTHVVFWDNTAAHSALVRADGGTALAASIAKEFVNF